MTIYKPIKSGPVTKRRLKPTADDLLAEQDSGYPIWVRAPKVGTEYYTGLSRSKLYEGAANGHFRSVSIREPGQTKGTRLFNLASVLAYIEHCETAASIKEKACIKQGGAK